MVSKFKNFENFFQENWNVIHNNADLGKSK